MRRACLVLALVVFCMGCTYSPRYSPTPSTDSSLQPCHLSVAVTPINLPGSTIWDKMLGANLAGMTDALMRDLAAARLFESQKLVAAKYQSCDMAALNDLRAKGYDAVLVVTLRGITAGSNRVMNSIPLRLAGPGAMAIANSTPQERYGTMAIDYRLVDVSSGESVSFGSMWSTVYVAKGLDWQAEDEAVKATFAKLIKDIRDTEVADPAPRGSPQNPR